MDIFAVDRQRVGEFARQWDEVADTRLRQISSGSDVSYSQTLLPSVLEPLPPKLRVLDLGCGIGALSAAVADSATKVVAIDPSSKSIDVASKNFSRPNIDYIVSSAEGLPGSYDDTFDAVVSNMVLMDVINLDGVVSAAHAASRKGGLFIATLTHPCFWPKYFGYEDAGWFEYGKEIFIVAPFRIANELTAIQTVHIHRPLESYFTALTGNGFGSIRLTELYGSGPFAYPRFIRLVAIAS